MPYNIVLTDAKILGFQIYRREDEAGNSQFVCSLVTMLHNDAGQAEKKTLKFQPTPEELSGLKEIMKPRIQEVCTEHDVNPPEWAQ